jgi:toxin ParE1/3/4
MLPVILRPEAEADIRVIHSQLEEVRPGLGTTFVDRVREVLERIEKMPELHGAIWEDVRAVRLRKFRYILYYIVGERRLEVLAVLHGARDPAVWHSRK